MKCSYYGRLSGRRIWSQLTKLRWSKRQLSCDISWVGPHDLKVSTSMLISYKIGAGRVQVAQSLLALLPPELTSVAEPEEVATEYLHYRQFFVIWEMVARIVEYQAEESSMAVHGATRDAKTAWVTEYRVCLFKAWFSQIVFDQLHCRT